MEQVKALADRSLLVLSGAPPSGADRPAWTPPSRPTDAAPSGRPAAGIPAPPSIVRRTDARSTLDELVASVDGVRSAVLATVDGFGIAQSGTSLDEAAHPAMLAAATGIAHQLVAMSGGDRLRRLVVDHDAGLMLVWPIGSQRVLAVMGSSTIDQRRARSFVQAHLAVLSGERS